MAGLLIVLAVGVAHAPPAKLNVMDYLIETSMLIGACERYAPKEMAGDFNPFGKGWITAQGKLPLDAQNALQEARQEGRTMHLTGEQCAELIAQHSRPSYLAKFGLRSLP